MISAQCFSHLLLWLYISSFRNGEWTTDATLYPSFQVTCLQRFVFSEMWIHLRLCFGSTSCHSKATYGSCRQPASHKSCKVPENMIYELSYGKWGPLIFLTLQDAVTCHRMFFPWVNGRCVWMFSSPIAPTSTPNEHWLLPFHHHPQGMCSFFKSLTECEFLIQKLTPLWPLQNAFLRPCRTW